MDPVSVLFLLGLGFTVGLSGAMIPGPLLVYTVNESLHRGKWTGIVVITGHAIVEVIVFSVITLLLLKLTSPDELIKASDEFIRNSHTLIRSLSLLGGIALILMATFSLKNINKGVGIKPKKTKYGAVAGGMIFTAFNPTFLPWWAVVGTTLLIKGLEVMGFLGMVLVFLGHLGADFGWFFLVSMTTSKGSGLLFERGWYKAVRTFLSLMLLAIGLYFLLGGL